jgi:lipoprotein-releasing system permease protein
VKLPFFIARRYFFSRRNPSVINIIAFISIIGYAVGSLALVVLLSALNGFENIIFQVYDTYYPDLKVQPSSGKVFMQEEARFKKLRGLPGIAAVSMVLEENAILQYGDNQVVGVVKGVSAEWPQVVKTDSLVVAGQAALADSRGALGWLAEGVIYKLNLGREAAEVNVMAPRRESVGVAQLDMMEEKLRVGAMVKPGEEMNQKLLLVPLQWARELFERDSALSALEIKLKPNANTEKVAEDIRALFGNGFKVKDRRMQNEAVYKMFNTEKWVAVAIMSFVLMLVSFNLIGSLTMLVLEKKKDIQLLHNLGMPMKKIGRIFLQEGMLVAIVGTVVGLALGIGLVLMQQKYGWVKTNSTFVVAYPVELRWFDLGLISGLSILLGFSSAFYPAIKSTRGS